MASFSGSSQSAGGGGGGGGDMMGPSSRSFFDDSHRPTAFASMAEWVRIRNFLFYFGVVHRNKKQVDGAGHISFSDPRVIAFDVARMMNTRNDSELAERAAVSHESICPIWKNGGEYARACFGC